jgi:hypothetical protein
VATFNSAPEFRKWVEQNPIRPGRHSGTARAALERRTIYIPDALDQLEAEATSLKGKLTLGTISVVCALGYLDFRFASHGLARQAPQASQVVCHGIEELLDQGDGAGAGVSDCTT